MTAASETAGRGRGGALRQAAPVAVAVLLFASVAALTVPRALGRWYLTPDSIEHAAVAYNLAQGEGLFDPILYNYAYEGRPPVPATLFRAPVLPILLSVPFAMGANLAGVQAAHAVFAAFVIAATFLVGLRFMSVPAALAAAALIGFSPVWLLLSERLWAEAAGVAAYLLVLCTIRGVARSIPAAFLCSVATVLAWLSRPNLAPVFLAVVVAQVFALGVRPAVRRKALWAYALSVFILYVGVQEMAEALTGARIYGGYSGTLTRLDTKAASNYFRSSSGVLEFVLEHAEEIGSRIGLRCIQLYYTLCRGPVYNWLGWWLPIGVVLFFGSASGRRTIATETVVNLLCAVGFAAIVVLNYADFDQFRYPLMCGIAAGMSGVALLEQALGRFADGRFSEFRERFRGSWSWIRIAPLLLLVAAIVVPSIVRGATEATELWRVYRTEGTFKHSFGVVLDEPIGRLCSNIDPEALIAGDPPLAWMINFWCGNPTLSMPRDVTTPEQWVQFRDERRPDYVVLRMRRGRRMTRYPGLRRSPEEYDEIVAYEVDRAHRVRPQWVPPRPVSCAGERECPTRPLPRPMPPAG